MLDATEVIQQAREAAHVEFTWKGHQRAVDTAVRVVLQELRERISPGEQYCTCGHVKPHNGENIFPFHTSTCGRRELMVDDLDDLRDQLDELLKALDGSGDPSLGSR